jgi:hypothetical protein
MALFLKSLWQESRSLTIVGAVMMVDLVLSFIGLAVDPRVVTGAPVWLKPAKFAISTAIFCGSIAWLYRYLPDFPKTKKWIGRLLAAILFVEIALIDWQAMRGTTSHFNVSTPENAIIFSVMGASIGILWLASVWIAVLLFRQRFDDAAWGWALRLGMLITVLGSAAAGFMLSPTAEQRAAMTADAKITTVGAHTVGAPDGGPGIPGVGWSKEHGDLRIPHFLGLHGLQVIPFVVWWSRRRSTRFVVSAAGSYFLLCSILAWQALRGESIVEPTGETIVALLLWLAVSVLAMFFSDRSGYRMDVLHER